MTKRKEQKMGLKDILAKTGTGLEVKNFVGQIIEILGAEIAQGQYRDDQGNARPYVKLTIKDESGETHEVSTGAAAIVGKVKEILEAEHLPAKVKVTSYPGRFGNDGYDIRDPDEVMES